MLLALEQMIRVGQNHVYTPYMTVHMVISLPKYRIYAVYIRFWSALQMIDGPALTEAKHAGNSASLSVPLSITSDTLLL